MKILRLLSILILGLAIARCQAQQESLHETQAAFELFHAANQARANNNLPPLTWDSSLAQAAAQHSQQMAERRTLSHQFPGELDLAARTGQAGAHFRKIAENVALGPSAPVLHTQWMKSPPHRANILDPQLTSIGIAVIRSDGYLYATEDFATKVAALSPAEIEEQISSLIEKHGIAVTARQRQIARQTCAMESGSAGGQVPGFIMRWEGSDLSRLPGALVQRMATGRYHSAAVGACNGSNPGEGFTSYRVAVLLY